MASTVGTAAVMGAGAWGTALAKVLADAGNDVRLWARRAEVADEVRLLTAFFNEDALPFMQLHLWGSRWIGIGIPKLIRDVSEWPVRPLDGRPPAWIKISLTLALRRAGLEPRRAHANYPSAQMGSGA